jgi:hypothetical protein
MATTDVQGGVYYNMLSVSPLLKDNKVNTPATNMFRDNTMLTDAVVQQANELMGHEGAFGTYMPTAQVVKVGAYRSTSTAAWGTFRDDISIFSDASAIPKDVADIQGTSWLSEEENTKANAFGQSTENHLIYGTSGPTTDTIIIDGTSTTPTAKPEKYTGLAPRFLVPDDDGGDGYNAMNPNTSNGAQKGVWSAGGTGNDTTSIWFIRWGKRAASLITPLNDPQYGLKVEDLGLQMAWSGDTYRRCYMTEYEWKHGLSIYPGEMGGNHVARIRNIENDPDTDHSALKSLIFQVIRRYFLTATEGIMMYVPPVLMAVFDVLYEAKTNIIFTRENPYALSPDNWSGKVFIRQCRAINEYETAVAPV